MTDGRHGFNTGTWTKEEDELLTKYVRIYGDIRWSHARRYMGLNRDAKSCRLRWTNHLRPNLERSAFTPEERRTVEELHARIGDRWADIAAQLPGRTDIEIMNFWNSRAGIQPNLRIQEQAHDLHQPRQPLQQQQQAHDLHQPRQPLQQQQAHYLHQPRQPLQQQQAHYLHQPRQREQQSLAQYLYGPHRDHHHHQQQQQSYYLGHQSQPTIPLCLLSPHDLTRYMDNNTTAMNLTSNTTTTTTNLSFPPVTSPVNGPNYFPVTPADPSNHMSMPHSFPVTPAGPSNRMSMPHSFPVTPAGPSDGMTMPHSFPVTPAGPSNRMSMPTYSQLPPSSSNPHTYSTSYLSPPPHSPYWITPDLHSNQIPSLNAQHFGSHSRMWRDNENDNSNNTNTSRLGILDEAEALNSDDGGSQEYKRRRLMSPARWGSTGNTSCSYSEVKQVEEDSIQVINTVEEDSTQVINTMNDEELKNMLDDMLSATATGGPEYNGEGEISNEQSSSTTEDEKLASSFLLDSPTDEFVQK